MTNLQLQADLNYLELLPIRLHDELNFYEIPGEQRDGVITLWGFGAVYATASGKPDLQKVTDEIHKSYSGAD